MTRQHLYEAAERQRVEEAKRESAREWLRKIMPRTFS
jgi:hypothetical protein